MVSPGFAGSATSSPFLNKLLKVNLRDLPTIILLDFRPLETKAKIKADEEVVEIKPKTSAKSYS
jgi:hypothetical protein